MAFSPDNTKLAIAQSDNIVFIYKVGLEWGDKKSICNKFPQSSSVTCMNWPNNRNGEIFFGLAEGKVKMGTLKNNNSPTSYAGSSYVVSISSSPDGQNVCSGHLDGTIITMNIESQAKNKLCQHTSIPYALSWGTHIIAAGNDGKVAFYDTDGSCFQRFDYSKDDKVKEFTSASFNQTGETAIIGNYNRFYVYNYNPKRPQWDEICCKQIENYYSVTACAWKSDSSKIAFGSLCGSVDIFDVCLKKSKYKGGKFEFNYVSLSQVIVKRIEKDQSIVVKSQQGSEITKINIYQDRFLVAHTTDSLLLGDMDSAKVSELPWRGSGNEKFDFSNPGVCMVFNAGELSIVEYGNNDIIGTCRTEHLHPNMISARLNYSEKHGTAGKQAPTKVIAYLLDPQTISIQDLNNQVIIANINHDAKIDFLELNPGGSKLLFRDKRKQLHLYNIKEQQKSTLLNYCNYVNWVPFSDVVVAQNRGNLCVWYSIDEPDKVTMYQIKGDVEQIERQEGKTEVIVDDGNNTFSYALDEALIEFGAALEYKSLESAVSILEPLELTPESEANWKALSKIAIEEQNLLVAERCYAALGDISKADYLRKINKLVAEEGNDNFRVQAKLAVLNKHFHQAEAILLNYNEVEEAMAMYQELHRWDESIKIAEQRNHPDVREFKENYYQWLLDTNQEAKAAELKEREGDYITSINLYLRGGLPAKAASIVNNTHMDFSQDVLEKIASSLTQSGMHEKAGEFFEKMGTLQRALDSYVRGHSFRKAIDLARKAFPAAVVNLEEEWGDWLSQQKQLDLAIGHYVEAGIFNKAIEAAIRARRWDKATQLVQNQPLEVARPYFSEIAKHYGEVRQLEQAERFFIKAGEYIEAFEMYVRANKWDAAFKVISRHLPESEYTMLYIKEAQKFEGEGHLKDAERMYISANEPDLAINMYKKAKQYDHMIRLVGKYRKDLLRDTHLHLAQQLEMELNHKQAEHHYVESGSWPGAVEMYRAHDMYEDAIRVAKTHGSQKEVAEIAIKVAESMGADAGNKFLIKNGLIDAAVDFEANKGNFTEAFRLAEKHAIYKKPEVHLKYALFLEDEKRFKEAEEEFIKANKPTEAISMYEHQQDWHSALQVARQFHPESVANVFMAQAKFYMERRDYAKAEGCFVNAKQPDQAINAYMEASMFNDALRVANKHAPHLVHEINKRMSYGGARANASGDELYNSAKMWEDSRDYYRAIDTYLQITEDHFQNPDVLEEIWEKAYTLAMTYAKDRVQEVVDVVGQRLVKIGKYVDAAQIFESVGQFDRAIDTYIHAKQFDRALECANQVRPLSLQQQMIEQIQRARKSADLDKGDFAGIVGRGDLSGLEMLIQKGDWDQCLSLAEKQGSDTLHQYLMRYAKQLLTDGRFQQAAQVFIRYGCQTNQQFLPFYKTIALEILAGSNEQELNVLRDMLRKLCDNLSLQIDGSNPVLTEFNEYMLITHYSVIKSGCSKNQQLGRVGAAVSVALLRYTKVIRADKAFLDAGNATKQEQLYSNAFVFLNRYLDLADAIDDPEGAALADNTDFNTSDIPSPYDIPLPEKNILSEQERDEIKDWVLQMSMDTNVEQSLTLKDCDYCGQQEYNNNLTCPQTGQKYEPCIVSGKPLKKKKRVVQCSGCGKKALRKYWNLYVGGTQKCPWCASIQTAY